MNNHTFQVLATNFIRKFTGTCFKPANAHVHALQGAIRFTVGRIGDPGAVHIDMDSSTAAGVAARLLASVKPSQVATPEVQAQLDDVEKYVRALRAAAKAG